jgi:HD-GYP domain-containing protein (c-di-GMP phosphodiesterase class II)
LEEAFDTAFTAVFKDGEWVAPVNSSLSRLAAGELDEVWRSARPRILATSGGPPVVVVPIPQQSVEVVLIGAVSPNGVDLAIPLVSTILASFEQSRQVSTLSNRLDNYAACVTHNFEELTLLRSLAQQIEICDIRSGMTDVADSILPALRDIIGAETVLLIEARPTGIAIAAAAGEYRENEAKLATILEHFGPNADHRPAVVNLGFQPAIDQMQYGAQNFILARVSKGHEHFGWLLALDRRPHVVAGAAGCFGEGEFGTSEAGLLQAAATMLSAQAYNSRAYLQIQHLLIGIIRAMINVIDAKDAYTWGHSDRVALISKQIAASLGLDQHEQERIYMAGLLHDVGKIGVPDEVLGKTGRLNDEEFAKIKRHPQIGCAILQHLKQLDFILPGVLHHHESFDGRGYPDGLCGEEIPLPGRIIAVADAYDAMTSDRPYRPGMTTEKAESILKSGAGKQWDGKVLDAFFSAIDQIRGIVGTERSHLQIGPAEPVSPANDLPDDIALSIQSLLT